MGTCGEVFCQAAYCGLGLCSTTYCSIHTDWPYTPCPGAYECCDPDTDPCWCSPATGNTFCWNGYFESPCLRVSVQDQCDKCGGSTLNECSCDFERDCDLYPIDDQTPCKKATVDDDCNCGLSDCSCAPQVDCVNGIPGNFLGACYGASIEDPCVTEFGDPRCPCGSEVDCYPGVNNFMPCGGAPCGVGGIIIPVDKLTLLTPYIALASTVIVATVATAIYAKRVKPRKEK